MLLDSARFSIYESPLLDFHIVRAAVFFANQVKITSITNSWLHKNFTKSSALLFLGTVYILTRYNILQITVNRHLNSIIILYLQLIHISWGQKCCQHQSEENNLEICKPSLQYAFLLITYMMARSFSTVRLRIAVVLIFYTDTYTTAFFNKKGPQEIYVTNYWANFLSCSNKASIYLRPSPFAQSMNTISWFDV